MKHRLQTSFKWTLFSLLVLKTLATALMFFSSDLFNCLYPLSLSSIPYGIAYIFSVDKTFTLAPLFLFIVVPLCHIAGLVLLPLCKHRTLPPAILLSVTFLSDIICMIFSLNAGTFEAGKIFSIVFNLLLLISLAAYTVLSKKKLQ